MQTLRLAFGLAVGLGLMLAGLLLEGGHVSSLVSPAAAILVLGGGLGSAIIANPFAHFGHALKVVFLAAKRPKAEADGAARIYAAFGKGAFLSGFLGAVLGAIHVFANLDKPEFIGPGVALAFVSIAYGFGLNVFFAQPLVALARAKVQPVSKGVAHELRPVARQDLAA